MLRRNVLIFHSGALGDFVLTWPLALALGRMYAQSRIIYVCPGGKGELATRALRIESADVEAGWHRLFSAEPELPANLQRMLEGAHLIATFVAGEGSVWANNVRRLAPHARLRLIDPVPPDGYAGHITQFMLDQLSGDAVVHTAVGQMLRSVGERGLGVTGARDGPVIVHPGAGGEAKCWSKEKFLELCRRFAEAGHAVEVVLGEVEMERWEQRDRERFASVATVRMPATLVDLYATLARASRFIGNDTGPTHLSGIMGIATTALFFSTSPAVWRPLGPAVRVVMAEAADPAELAALREGTVSAQ
jgi:ADP-heptose:LPS heptosyltransferase